MSDLSPPAPHEGGDAPRPDPRLVDVLDRVRRALRYGLREEGTHLWAVPWLGRTNAALLRSALRLTRDEPIRRALQAAVELLEPVDGLPWTSRLEPVSAALLALEGALPEARVEVPLTPRAQLIVLAAEEEAPRPAPAPAPAAAAAAPPVEDEEDEDDEDSAEPEEPRLPLGDPRGTGQPLGVLGALRPGLEEALHAAGVHTVADLLGRVPIDQHRLVLLGATTPPTEDGADLAVHGTVGALAVRLRPSGRVQELWVRAGEHTYRCRWMGELPPDLPTTHGAPVCVGGRLEWTEEGPILYEGLRWEYDARGFARRPIYGIPGVADEDLWPLVRRALVTWGDRLVDPLPPRLAQDARVPPLEEALRELHVPNASLRRGRARLVFDDFFLQQLGSAGRAPARLRGIAHTVGHEALGRLQLTHAFALNDAQEQVFDEIRRDLRRSVAMNRLLQGDVGAGKALLALATAVVVCASARSQVLVLCPDQLAAEHRYQFAEPLLRAAGLTAQVLSGEGAAPLDAVRRGDLQVLFATHELARRGLPEFKKLGLVVVEERGTYGVISREDLAQKGVHPDLLVVTSVPVPTILTFTLYADYDISVIREDTPPTVECAVRTTELRSEAFSRICEQLARGRQAYVVLPMVRGQDAVDLPTARQLAEALGSEAFPGYRVGVYHGAMPQAERLRVYDDFEHRRLDVILATTVIEDAPEVPNATCMLVENAERYDLVRLHRLRGHVGRGPYPGLCTFVLGAKAAPEGVRLVELVAKEPDGFAIAEQDRMVRGDEALLGHRVAEMPSFRVGDPSRDREVLLRARRAALTLLQQDPQLKQRAHRELAALVFGRVEEPEPAAGAAGGRSKRKRRRRKGGR